LPRRLLASSDLYNAPEVWLPKLQSAYRDVRDMHELPDLVRDVGFVLQLDGEIRTGGFAQYFFNPACRDVYDAWFVLVEYDRICADLVSEALRRIGVSYQIDLDPTRLPDDDDGEALRIARGRLIDAVTQARAQSGTLIERFTRFRDRLAEDVDGADGLEHLTRCWLNYDEWKEAIVSRVLGNRFEFTR
jgi:hypothetical protein